MTQKKVASRDSESREARTLLLRALNVSAHGLRALVAAAALAVACCSPAAQAAVLDPRAVQSETFANGLRLIVCPDSDASVVSVEVVVKAGSADEPAGHRGIAHLLEHVLWAGAGGGEEDPSAEFALSGVEGLRAGPRLRVERVGGVINGGTLRDFTRFYATVPAGRLELAVDALAGVVVRGAIDPAVLARERQVIAQESVARQEEPRTVLSDAAFAALYGPATCYGSPIEGNAGDLSKATVAELSLFRDTWYVPNNMAVVVAGNTRFEAARAAVEQAFGGLAPAATPLRAAVLRAGDTLLPHNPSAEFTLSRVEGLRAGLAEAASGERRVALPTEKAYLMAAFLGPRGSERMEVCATDLLATLLAHDPAGRLVVELREGRGIVDEVGVDFLTQRESSLFGIWASCDPGRVVEVQEAIRSELARLAREPVPPRELATAKRLLAAGYAFANETPADRASTLGFYEAMDSYRTATNYLAWVMDTGPETIMATAARYAGQPTWVVVAPEGGER
jgi:predicted Zn-dependent peptidase